MLKTNEFVDDIKTYLKNAIIEIDNNFSNLETYTAYTYEHTPVPPEIDVYINDDSDDLNSNSYESENLSSISLNIYCYANAMQLNGETKTSAVETSTLLAQYVKQALDKNVLASKNTNVISSQRTSYTGAMNVRDTLLYVVILRYDFKVRNNYIKIYN